MVSYMDAYKSKKAKRAAALRVLSDAVDNRPFAMKAYQQLDFNDAVAYILSELINKEEK
jgi:hypothetical protein